MGKISKVFRNIFWKGLLIVIICMLITIISAMFINGIKSLSVIPASIGVFVWFGWVKYKKYADGSMLEGLLLGIFCSIISGITITPIVLARLDERLDRNWEQNRENMLKGKDFEQLRIK